MVPGKKVPHFKAGKELRERVDAAFQDGSSSDVKDVSGANQDDRQLEAIG
jgi:integration host factor subunit beta